MAAGPPFALLSFPPLYGLRIGKDPVPQILEPGALPVPLGVPPALLPLLGGGEKTFPILERRIRGRLILAVREEFIRAAPLGGPEKPAFPRVEFDRAELEGRREPGVGRITVRALSRRFIVEPGGQEHERGVTRDPAVVDTDRPGARTGRAGQPEERPVEDARLQFAKPIPRHGSMIALVKFRDVVAEILVAPGLYSDDF